MDGLAVVTGTTAPAPEGTWRRISGCRACGDADLEVVLDLGQVPLADLFPTVEEAAAGPDLLYPLTVAFCPACSLLQTREDVPATELFDDRVDGLVADDLGLPGKPSPDTFLEAARRLDTTAARAVVVEDAVVGVEAGRLGGFGFVIGVDREGDPDRLMAHGADVVVDDLGDLVAV